MVVPEGHGDINAFFEHPRRYSQPTGKYIRLPCKGGGISGKITRVDFEQISFPNSNEQCIKFLHAHDLVNTEHTIVIMSCFNNLLDINE